MDVFCRFSFAAARRLPNLPQNHRCSRLHGHTFEVEVVVSGALEDGREWVVDFDDLDAACTELKDELDHRYLNDLTGLDNPTSERLAIWLWLKMIAAFPGLSAVRVNESPSRGCVYRGV
ncbi:MAG: 6-carboxytetrahydropterin synthase QueD [Pseudomonadota bacterium]